MPWGAVTLMELKHQFILLYLEHERSITSLACDFGISRKTAYKWIERYSSNGLTGLKDLRTNAGAPSIYHEEIWEKIITLRLSYPTYGPRKLRYILQRDFPNTQWPCESRIKEELKKRKLSRPHITQPPHELLKHRLPLKEISGNNAVWCMDFKGHIQTCDKLTYEPFT